LLEDAKKGRSVSIVYPEGNDERIIAAARKVSDLRIAKPILIGDPKAIEEHRIDLAGIEVIDIISTSKPGELAELFERETGFPAGAVEGSLRDPINLAACMVRFGQADTLVGGVTYTTAQVILSCSMYIGFADGIPAPSSFSVFDVTGWDGGEDGLVAWADGAVCVNPDARELAGIAICTADSVKALLGWEPRVAMLSYSTKGSSEGPDADKVREATRLVKDSRPDICIDGEVQLDSAITPSVSLRKIKGDNPLEGRANVLVVPDINAGNIGIKMMEKIFGAGSYGPILQGFAKPLSDLSRGATVDDIFRTSIVVQLLANNQRKN
jgi:phosphate acetyltransferase